jgi:lysyl-tRNA synthetase, class II
MAVEEDNRLMKERVEKLNRLRELGINPYPYSFATTHESKGILKKYEKLKPEEKTSDKVRVAGRIMQLRRMGKATFMHIQDDKGKLQLYFRAEDIGDKTYELLKLLDMGDIIGVEGTVFKTKTGEVTVYASDFDILCKAVRPFPEKYHGLQDKELRYRKRYLDLIFNPESKDVFVKRSRMIDAVREFFRSRGFMDVETPSLQTIYGGANAKPFVTHINAWDMRMYLSISPELYLKRLLVGGFDKVFTICKNFRNEGVDRFHNPEFTMLESYQSYADYNDVMRLVEECFEHVCMKVNGTTKVKHVYNSQQVEIDFKAPWPRMTMVDALKGFAGVDVAGLDRAALAQLMINYNVEYEGDFTAGTAIQLLFEALVEDKLIHPIHIIDHPKETTPLCKRHRGNPELIERFESYCLGAELCNAYSELNDPLVQRKLLEEQAAELRGGVEEAHPMDEDFVEAIEYGMPPAGGLGIGIDRMAIVLTGAESIRDVILFPTMKPAGQEKTVEQQDVELKSEFKKVLKQ